MDRQPATPLPQREGLRLLKAAALFSQGLARLLPALALTAWTQARAANGLTGRYYDTAAFGTLKTTRTDATVNFDWGAATPAGTSLTSADTFSVVWTGQLEPEFSQLYTFYVTADDGARLWVNDQLVVMRTYLAATDMRGQARLRARERANIRLEYIEQTGSAKVKLEWSCASRAREVIPSERLLPAREEKAGGSLLKEHWLGIEGGTVTALTAQASFPARPSGREFITTFECLAQNWTNAYGTRVSGFLVPPESGTYTFAVSGDDVAELYLSADATTNSLSRIASVSSPTGFRVWDAQPSQQSAPLALTQGQRYYVEVLHKENAGTDHWSVGWRRPGETAFSVVPGSALVQPGLASAQPAESALLNTLAQEHPRLFATGERFARLRDLWQSAEPSQPKTWAQSTISGANAVLTQDPVTYSPDVRGTILEQSRTAKERLYKLAVAWQLTGDSQYAERAWEELSTVAAFPDWHPAHFLDTAEMTHACAIGYDWLYAYWSQAQRDIIRGAILTNGLQAGLSQYNAGAFWSLSSANNWNMVCNGGLSIGALAVGTESEALTEDILDRALNSTRPVWRHFTTDNGAWYEGPGYYGYTTEYGIRMLAALEGALGSDFGLSATTNLSESGFAPIHALGTSGKVFNYADAGAGGALRGPVFQWFARRYNQPLFTWWENQGGGGALDALWWDGQAASLTELEAAPDMAFHGEAGTGYQPQEMVTLRGNWSGSPATFIACKGGEMGASHGNLDAGTFVLDALGKRWFHDLGGDDYALPGYFSDAPSSGTDRWDYYRMRPEGQNTLTINPSANADMALGAVAPLLTFQSEPGGSGSFAIHDLTPVYSGVTRVWRGVRLLGSRDQALVQDEIQAATGKTVWWFAHYAYPTTTVELGPDGTSALMTQGSDRLWCKIVSGGGTFQLREATPLPTSPNPTNQNANAGFKKLAIQLANVTNTTLAVWFVPLSSEENPPASTPPITALNTWDLASDNAAPVASDGEAPGAEAPAVEIDLRNFVTDDSTPPEQMRFSVGQAVNGTVVLLADGHTARFTPAPGSTGTPNFTFTVTDAGPDPRVLLVYDFEPPDATATNTVPDASGLGRDGTLDAIGTGAATLQTDVPAAFARDGRSLDLAENGGANAARLSHTVATGNLNFNTGDWTVTGWFKRRDSANEDMLWHLNSGDGFGSNEELYLMMNSASNLNLHHYPGPDINITVSNLAANAWHHFAVVRSAAKMSLYVNGALAGEDATFTLAINQTYPLIFGGHTDTTAAYAPRWLDGRLDDLAVFKAALAPAEIASLAGGLTVRHLGGLSATGTVTVATSPAAFAWTNTLAGSALPWSNGSNWSGSTAPASSRGASVLFFSGQTLTGGAITSHNDTAGDFFLNRLTLAGTASATTTVAITGSGLTFLKNGRTLPTATLSASSGAGLAYTLAAPVNLGADTTFDGSGSAPLRFSGPISGTGALVKASSGTLLLTGENSYSGETRINTGTLQIGGDGPGGSLGPGDVVNNGQLRFDRTGTLTVPNRISGTGSVYLDCPINAGTVVLSGSNSFSGHVTVNSGALRITGSSALGSANKTVTLNNGTLGAPQLRLDGSSAPIELPRSISFSTSSNGSNTGALMNEAGTNTLSGNITLTGGGGDTKILVTAGSLTLAGTLAPNTTGRTLQLAGAGTGLITGAITNGGLNILNVAKFDSGTWLLAGTNTYSGTTTINSGTLALGSASALGNGGDTDGGCSVSSGATLDLNGQMNVCERLTVRGSGVGGLGGLVNSSASPASVTGGVALAANTVIGGGDIRLDAPVSGAFSLTKIGAGTLTLAGTNTYTGATAVSNGTLALSGALTSHVTVAGGTLAPRGAPRTAGNLTVAGSGRFAARIAGPAAGANYDQLTVGGTVTLAGALDLAALTNLTPGSSFTLIDKAGSGAVTGTFATLPDNSTFAAAGYIWRITYAGGTGNDVVLSLLRLSTFTNVWNNATAGAALTWTAGANWQAGEPAYSSPDGTVEFFTGQTLSDGSVTASNDNSGTFQLARLRLAGAGPAAAAATVALGGGGLELGAGDAPPSLSLEASSGSGGLTYSVANPLTLAKTAAVEGSGSASFILAGRIQGGGGLAKSGTAALTLSGANTFSGGTTLSNNAGTLRATVSATQSALGTGAVAIGAGATLSLHNANTSSAPVTVANAFTGAGGLSLNLATGAVSRTTALPGLSGFAGTLLLTSVGRTGDKWDAGGVLAPDAAVQIDAGTTLALSSAPATFGSLSFRSVDAALTNTVSVAPGLTLTVSGTNGLLVGTDSGTNSFTRARMAGGGALTVTQALAPVVVGKAQASQNYANNSALDLSGLGSVTFGNAATPLTELRVGFGLTATGLLTLSDTSNTVAAATLQIGHSSGGNAGGGTVILGAGANLLCANTVNIGLSKSNGTVKFASQAAGSPGTVTIGGKNGGSADFVLGSKGGTGTSATPTGTLDLRGHSATVTAGSMTLGKEDSNTTLYQGGAAGYLYFDAGTFSVSNLTMAAKLLACPSAATAALTVSGGTFTVIAGGSVTLASQSGAGSASGTLNLLGGLFRCTADLRDGGGNATSTLTLSGGSLDMTGHAIGSPSQRVDVVQMRAGTLMNLGQLNNGEPLVKTGAGTLTLSGTNTYTGPTIVSNGTLRLTGPAVLPASASLHLVTGATADLAFAGTQAVHAVYINGAPQSSGVYGASQLPSYLTGSGYLETEWPPAARTMILIH